jgi:hypothetical protein
VNIAPVSGPRISPRIVRVLAMMLMFVCAGTLIQFALEAILSFVWDKRFVWPTVMPIAEGAGLTGLVTGVYDASYDRVDARTMLVISLVMLLAALILILWMFASAVFRSGFGGEVILFFLFLGFLLVHLFRSVVSLMCFVVSMMACWKLIDVARDRIPAAGRLLGQ